jgi:hypothetical protein
MSAYVSHGLQLCSACSVLQARCLHHLLCCSSQRRLPQCKLHADCMVHVFRSGGGGGGGVSEKGLTTGFRGINAICDRLALVKIIRDRACEILKKVFVVNHPALCSMFCST